MFIDLNDIYEPSAIQQLADGRFLVVEDEPQRPFSLIRIGLDGRTFSEPLAAKGKSKKLNDLEGITMDAEGWLYAITSHSRDSDGDEDNSRQRLLRFRIDDGQIEGLELIKGLKSALVADHPVLAAAAGVLDVKGGSGDQGGFNIEALELCPDRQRLIVGFRSPLHQGRALLACMDQPAAGLGGSSGDSPGERLGAWLGLGDRAAFSSRLLSLDLGGQGLRGMAWVPVLAGYLLISGPVGREIAPFALWFWAGGQDDAARRVTITGLPEPVRAEGICPAVIEGQPRIVIVSDDGDRKAGRAARFLLLEPGQLRIVA